MYTITIARVTSYNSWGWKYMNTSGNTARYHIFNQNTRVMTDDGEIVLKV